MSQEFKVNGKKYMIKETIPDKIVKYFSPEKGQKRLRARAQLALSGGYTSGSRTKRSMRGWKKTSNDADGDLLPDLDEIRDNSGDLIRNAPLAAGSINTICTSVVGAGLMVNSSIDKDYVNLNDDEAKAWERQADRLFYDFAESKECDITRTQNFFEQQDLFFRSTLERGDIFVLLPYLERAGSQYALKTRFIEADRVRNKNHAANNEKLAGGIELDDVGAPKSVHILKTHPGSIYSSGGEWDVVDFFGKRTGRRNVLHGFERLRVGQHRGVPLLSPVIELFKQLDRYTEAEIMAAVVSGMFTVFVKTEEGDTDFDFGDDKSDSSTSSDDLQLGVGAIVGLADGESIETANPGRPNANFDPFFMSIIKQIGSALELPPELILKIFMSSYSASRAAFLEAWRMFKKRRQWLVWNFCQPVYEAFITEQVAAGRIDAPGFFDDPLIRRAYLGAEWIGRPMGHIQPLQEAKAATERVNTGITNLQKEAREYDGGDWEKIHRQRAYEVSKRSADNIETSKDSAKVDTAGKGSQQSENT